MNDGDTLDDTVLIVNIKYVMPSDQLTLYLFGKIIHTPYMYLRAISYSMKQSIIGVLEVHN